MDDVTELPKVNREELAKLGNELSKKFSQYSRDRKSAEVQWVKSLRQFNGTYDPEVLSRLQPTQSTAYPRLTRVKVVSMVARLMSLLFPSGEKNWGFSRSPEPLFSEEAFRTGLELWAAEAPDEAFDQELFDQFLVQKATESAAAVERRIDDQLGDMGEYGPMDYATLVKKVVRSAVMYGAGTLKGPTTVASEAGEMTIANGQPMVGTTTVYRPYFEFVHTGDYFPDLSATEGTQPDGAFVRHKFSAHQLKRLAQREDFAAFGDDIRTYLRDNPEGNATKGVFDGEQTTNNETQKPLSRKYEVLEFWGHIDGHMLRAAGVDVKDDELDADLTGTVWMIDKLVVKAQRSPFPEDFQLFHTFVFEDNEASGTGVGLPEIMRDSQLSLCSATRMLLDNASVVCGPNVEVDIDAIEPGQDMTFAPFKVWMSKGGAAVKPVAFDARMNDLLSVINLFTGMADTETFVGPATGGDMSGLPSEGMRTTGGASMIMASAALPFRDVVRNFDRFTVSVINSLVRWNEVLNPADDAIIMGDMRPVGKGATTLMAKEIRAYSLDNLAQTLLEEERDYINMENLARQRLLTRDLPLDELMLPEAEARARRESRMQQQQQLQQQQAQLFEEEVKSMRANSAKQLAQAKKNLDGADTDALRAIISALESGVDIDAALSAIAGGPPQVAVPSTEQSGDRTGLEAVSQ